MSKWHARAYLAAILLISTGVTIGFAPDPQFEPLPFFVQVLVIIAAVITGAGWVMLIGVGLALLIGKAFS